MRELTGDIWQLSDKNTDWIVVPTNIGWKSDGKNVMGRGLARQATRRWPELAQIYGDFCRTYGETTPIMLYRPQVNRWCETLLLFPVKPLNVEKPYLSWRQPADLDLIRRHSLVLQSIAPQCRGKILMPSVGCGNGGLDETQVLPVLYAHLTHHCFHHVRLQNCA